MFRRKKVVETIPKIEFGKFTTNHDAYGTISFSPEVKQKLRFSFQEHPVLNLWRIYDNYRHRAYEFRTYSRFLRWKKVLEKENTKKRFHVYKCSFGYNLWPYMIKDSKGVYDIRRYHKTRESALAEVALLNGSHVLLRASKAPQEKTLLRPVETNSQSLLRAI